MNNIYSAHLLQVCEDVTKQLGLHNDIKRVTILYNDANPNQIAAWVVVDRVGNILERYDDLEKLYSAHAK